MRQIYLHSSGKVRRSQAFRSTSFSAFQLSSLWLLLGQHLHCRSWLPMVFWGPLERRKSNKMILNFKYDHYRNSSADNIKVFIRIQIADAEIAWIWALNVIHLARTKMCFSLLSFFDECESRIKINIQTNKYNYVISFLNYDFCLLQMWT